MTKLLTLKHWQLFFLLMGLPVVFQFFVMNSIMTSHDFKLFFVAFPVLMILVMVLYFGWFYALGTNLHKKLPGSVTMNLNLFKIFLFLPMVYILFFSVFMFKMFNDVSAGGRPNLSLFALIIPLHL